MQMHLGLEELGKIGAGWQGVHGRVQLEKNWEEKKEKEPREEDPKGAGLTTRRPGQVAGLLARNQMCVFGRRPEAAPTVNLM